jgi:hypothetical protein
MMRPVLALVALVVFSGAVATGVNLDDIEAKLDDISRQVNGHTALRVPPKLRYLEIADPIDDGTYRRAAFGSGWGDLDGDRCNTREEIMARDLVDVVAPDGCNVESGTLHDPYTGRTVRFVEDEDPMAVQVDHVYPLSRAWQMGASDWTPERRLYFANDPRNLLAVDGPTNASKGDSGPGEWVPANRDYACSYARRYIRVATVYDLPVTTADRDSLAALLTTCEDRS